MSEVKETGGVSIGGESLRASPKVLTAGDRKLLKVELRPGDTTYVSWKKLMRDASKVNGSSASVPDPPPNANPNLESRIAPPVSLMLHEMGQPAEIETNDQPHSNRFNAVIEKIERLYKGNDSSDGEELDGAPDDDEYDTEDSFIDDAELDEYFEVDNSAVKHDGFYVNRGKLERIEPSTTSNQQPKKRRRKDPAKPFGDAVGVSDKHTKLSLTARGKSTASGSSLKRKYNVARKTQEPPFPFGAQDANISLSLDDVKHSDRANHQNKKDTCPKSKETGSSSALHQKYSNKGLHQQSKSLPGKSLPNVSAEATIVRQKENNGMHELANAKSRQSSQASKRDGSNVKSKISILEKAIRELEKVVAECEF
ncbi:PREDICTED: uncharacterized protein LOC104740854 isoform X3 [Camelina sativa]|uniref:Uncharacterized protein LOC104740854 isoform X3 n=1 Tax=Camelina sativa TaxID=90675 RepID=A0ABM0VR06_CAMSA|nr:PREDICTED: uncharacterized protein LOC104740854 isoform X3 [Camelina sativa]